MALEPSVMALRHGMDVALGGTSGTSGIVRRIHVCVMTLRHRTDIALGSTGWATGVIRSGQIGINMTVLLLIGSHRQPCGASAIGGIIGSGNIRVRGTELRREVIQVSGSARNAVLSLISGLQIGILQVRDKLQRVT